MYLTAQRMLIMYATIKHDSSKFFILSANTVNLAHWYCYVLNREK